MNKKKLNIAGAVIVVLLLAVIVVTVIAGKTYSPTKDIVTKNSAFKNISSLILYENFTNGYSISRPPDWEVSELPDGTVLIIGPNVQAGRAVFISSRDITIKELKKEYENDPVSTVYAEKNRLFLGKDSTELTLSTATGLDETVLFIPREGKKSVIINYHAFNTVHERIVNTFKFIK